MMEYICFFFFFFALKREKARQKRRRRRPKMFEDEVDEESDVEPLVVGWNYDAVRVFLLHLLPFHPPLSSPFSSLWSPFTSSRPRSDSVRVCALAEFPELESPDFRQSGSFSLLWSPFTSSRQRSDSVRVCVPAEFPEFESRQSGSSECFTLPSLAVGRVKRIPTSKRIGYWKANFGDPSGIASVTQNLSLLLFDSPLCFTLATSGQCMFSWC